MEFLFCNITFWSHGNAHSNWHIPSPWLLNSLPLVDNNGRYHSANTINKSENSRGFPLVCCYSLVWQVAFGAHNNFFLWHVLHTSLISRPYLFWWVDVQVIKDLFTLSKPFSHIWLIGSHGPCDTKVYCLPTCQMGESFQKMFSIWSSSLIIIFGEPWYAIYFGILPNQRPDMSHCQWKLLGLKIFMNVANCASSSKYKIFLSWQKIWICTWVMTVWHDEK